MKQDFPDFCILYSIVWYYDAVLEFTLYITIQMFGDFLMIF